MTFQNKFSPNQLFNWAQCIEEVHDARKNDPMAGEVSLEVMVIRVIIYWIPLVIAGQNTTHVLLFVVCFP